MSDRTTDVAIIGGGPAGSAAATVLARNGWRATILERERFPRFHVGESLLPRQGAVLERLGVLSKVQAAGFMPKYGALFLSSDGACTSPLDFGELIKPPYNFAYQVERSRFDHLLLEHARDTGAEVLEEHTVVEADLAETGSRLRVRGPGGDEHTLSCRWVIDASGQQSFLAKKLGIRELAEGLRKVAHFAHFEGGKRHPGRREGDISLVFGRGCWIWHIPLSRERVSVGCVVDHERWKGSSQSAVDFLESAIADSPWLRDWMAGTERVTDAHTLANFSYTAKHFVGPGYLLAGDAATFLDPVFSTGVMLALRSGEEAALALSKGLSGKRPLTVASLDGYEKKIRGWTKQYFRMIRAFYEPQFPAILFNQVPLFVKPVVFFLGGGLEMPLHYRALVEVFHWIVKLNKGYRIAPDPRSPEAAVYHGGAG